MSCPTLGTKPNCLLWQPGKRIRETELSDAVATVMEQDHTLFSEVVSEIEKDIPVKHIDRDRKRTHRYALPTDLSIRKVTIVS